MSRKSVLITGCSEGGIGHNLALEWKSRGYRVFATARTLRSMTTLEQEGIECFEMDVTDLDTVKSVKDQVTQKTGGTLDIIVNNAGQGKWILGSYTELRIYNAFTGQ
jgi:1-acylglycerone phosphate reductase